MELKDKKFLSTSQLAELLGISRVAVFKKIKRGEIKAKKVGRNFVIDASDFSDILKKTLSQKSKKDIDKAVHKLIKEYGETLRLLGKND